MGSLPSISLRTGLEDFRLLDPGGLGHASSAWWLPDHPREYDLSWLLGTFPTVVLEGLPTLEDSLATVEQVAAILLRSSERRRTAFLSAMERLSAAVPPLASPERLVLFVDVPANRENWPLVYELGADQLRWRGDASETIGAVVAYIEDASADDEHTSVVLQPVAFMSMDRVKHPLTGLDGESIGAAVERSLWIELALALLRHHTQGHEGASALWNDLECVHTPVDAAARERGQDAALRVSIANRLRLMRQWTPGARIPDLPITETSSREVQMPPARLIKGAWAAEAYAAEVLQAIGYRDAQATGHGPDGGVDVVGTGVVGQVKFEALPVGRPAIQSLFGVAAFERSTPVFFTLAGYTRQALEWAETAGVACFEFTTDGSVVAKSLLASRLLLSGAPDTQS